MEHQIVNFLKDIKMSDLTNLTAELATTKTGMYNRLVAQGDTTIQAGDSMATYLSHYQNLVTKSLTTLNITENGTYTATSSLISGYGTINVNVPTGGPATHKRYSLLDSVYDDGNTHIGTVCGFFVDSNSVEYAVVCINAQYRNSSCQWAASTGAITNMPLYSNQTVYSAPETATENTTLILASKESSACSHCRAQSFVIGGTTYYGQLPNIIELIDIFRYRVQINTADITASTYSSLVIPTATNTWSSSQYNAPSGWYIGDNGTMSANTKTSNYFVAPVLEIPNTL
jgi:hypothetical protein